MEAAEDAGTVEIEWLPFELRPAPRPLLEVRGDHLRVDWTQNVYRRALAMGVEIHLPRYQPRSTLPLCACLWAGEQGRLRDVQARALRGVLLRGQDIATDRRSPAPPTRAGLDPDGAIEAAYSPERGRAAQRDPRRGRGRGRARRPVAAHRGRASTTGAWAGSSACSRASRWSRGLSDAACLGRPRGLWLGVAEGCSVTSGRCPLGSLNSTRLPRRRGSRVSFVLIVATGSRSRRRTGWRTAATTSRMRSTHASRWRAERRA